MSSRQILNLPKHQNPSPNRTASAPYNFVPLPEVVVTAVDSANDLPDHDRYYADRHTGYFEVTLTTKSPLYVRCPFILQDYLRQERGEDANAPFRQQVRNTPHFFYTRDRNQPVIPGSSLRGMLRNVLEIVSYGKVQWVTDKKLFFRTVDDTTVGRYYRGRMTGKVEAGFLTRRGGEFVIRVCQMARISRNKLTGSLYEGEGPKKTPRWNGRPRQWTPVWVKLSAGDRFVDQVCYDPTPEFREGRLIITGDIPGKNKEFVFLLPADDAEEIPVPEDLIERFHDDDQITQWQERAFPKDKPDPGCRERNGMLRKNLREHWDPVFFLRENGQLTFFGRAQMFRLPYSKCPIDLVPRELRRPEDIDYAEALFGFVRKNEEMQDTMRRGVIQELPKQGDKRRAYAGRVFVTDAVLVEGQTDYWLSSDPLTPKILATPKPTAFQHYLVQQEPERYRTGRFRRDGTEILETRLRHYDGYAHPPSSDETTIRGHKRYWHQGLNPSEGLTLDQIREHIEEERSRLAQLATSTQHTQFKPIKPGVQFRFRVYFENLSDRELGALCWALHPLGDPAKEYCHHLGMGKPLGMGAVKLEATLCHTDRSRRYASLLEGDNWQTGTSGTAVSLSDRATLERRTRAFEERILEVLGLNGTCAHLSELRRIAMLLKMMEWPGFRADLNGNCFLTAQNRPNTRYMTIQPNNEYRERPVLPDPRAFDPALDRLAEPLPDKGNPQNDASREQGSAPLKAKQDQRPTIPQGAVVATVQQVGDKWVDVQIEGHEAPIRCAGLTPAGLGLKVGSKIYVELKRDKSTKRVISASFKGMPR
jgi:CRISPR-associated protein (TIGR03986 family)